MIWIIVIIAVYLISAVGYWYYVHKNYKSADSSEFWTMLIPIVNTIGFIGNITENYNWNKFFKIK